MAYVHTKMKKVIVFRNGTNTDGKIFAVDPACESIVSLSYPVLSRFGIAFSGGNYPTFFTTEGHEINHCGLMGDSETLYFAMRNEKFIQPPPAAFNNVADTKTKATSTIKLNVGGLVFETTLGTLMKEPKSKLATMFSTNSGKSAPPIFEGAYFFDRDPKYFAPILNYLRTGSLILDAGMNPKGVQKEADFFGIRIYNPVELDSKKMTQENRGH